MRLTILGSGTSSGVPAIGCGCDVCTSSDPLDRRLRCSALLSVAPGRNLLIDCGPDFRSQILALGSPPIEGVLLTHMHYDHTGGLDDLRYYTSRPEYRRSGLPVYCREDVGRALRRQIPYCFEGPDSYPGAPRLRLLTIAESGTFRAAGATITPLAVDHGTSGIILGYRFGDALAYITDCKRLPEATLRQLRGVDTLVINALRHDSHHSHMNLTEALSVIDSTGPHKAYLTHMSHGIGLHSVLAGMLPEGVEPAYDGLVIDLPD